MFDDPKEYGFLFLRSVGDLICVPLQAILLSIGRAFNEIVLGEGWCG